MGGSVRAVDGCAEEVKRGDLWAKRVVFTAVAGVRMGA